MNAIPKRDLSGIARGASIPPTRRGTEGGVPVRDSSYNATLPRPQTDTAMSHPAWRIISDIDAARDSLLKRRSLRDISVPDSVLDRSESLFGERRSRPPHHRLRAQRRR